MKDLTNPNKSNSRNAILASILAMAFTFGVAADAYAGCTYEFVVECNSDGECSAKAKMTCK